MDYIIDYKNVLKSLADGILVFDLEGLLVDVSEEFIGMLGYTKNEIIGKHHADFSPEFQAENMNSIREKLRTFGYVKSHEVQYIRKDGTIVFAEVKIGSLKNDKKKFTSLIGFISGILGALGSLLFWMMNI